MVLKSSILATNGESTCRSTMRGRVVGLTGSAPIGAFPSPRCVPALLALLGGEVPAAGAQDVGAGAHPRRCGAPCRSRGGARPFVDDAFEPQQRRGAIVTTSAVWSTMGSSAVASGPSRSLRDDADAAPVVVDERVRAVRDSSIRQRASVTVGQRRGPSRRGSSRRVRASPARSRACSRTRRAVRGAASFSVISRDQQRAATRSAMTAASMIGRMAR